MKRVIDWLDERAGVRALLRHALDEKVPGGASFAYVFGSVLTVLLLVQMTTGVLLAFYYSPSSTDAWASVAYIQDQVTLGWFIRGLHSHGASALVIIAGLHLLQTALFGAYKRPRELNWLTGVMLLGLLLAFALTGYLLPWDQTGFWATKVATGIAGTSPLIGADLQQVLQGGNEYGNLTITRFFALHVFVLPAVTIGLVIAHIGLFRRHGVTPKWSKDKAALESSTGLFWPDQLFKDMVAVAVVFSVLIGVNLWTHGVGLDGPADPSSNFDARPEWYFRPLFQVLKYFHGPMETVVALGLPVVVGGILLSVPFLDRGAQRAPRMRLQFLVPIAIIFLGGGALTWISYAEDGADSELAERIKEAEEQAERARALAKLYGVPAAGGTAVYTTAPHYLGRTTFLRECAGCHQGEDREAPEITAGFNSRAWIRAMLKEPSGDLFFGRTPHDEMDPVEVDDAELSALVEFVYAQTQAADVDSALAARGESLFDDGECSDCHEREGTEPSDPGPNLFRRGTAAKYAEFIANPAAAHFYGESAEMPAFADDLDAGAIDAVAEYLVWLRDASDPEPPLVLPTRP